MLAGLLRGRGQIGVKVGLSVANRRVEHLVKAGYLGNRVKPVSMRSMLVEGAVRLSRSMSGKCMLALRPTAAL